MQKLQNRSSQKGQKYVDREQGFNKYMTKHESVGGNKGANNTYVIDVDEDYVKSIKNEKKRKLRHNLSFRVQRVLLLIEKDDQSFNAELMTELYKSRPFFKEVIGIITSKVFEWLPHFLFSLHLLLHGTNLQRPKVAKILVHGKPQYGLESLRLLWDCTFFELA